MNYVPVLAEVRRKQPDFWFEISTWDGQQPGQPSDKLLFYANRGQTYPPDRYGGMVQFGMWLLRPRVVRDFRGSLDDERIRFGPYFDRIMAAQSPGCTATRCCGISGGTAGWSRIPSGGIRTRRT